MSERKLAVFTPWYPSLGNRVLGNFVADWSRLASGGFDIRVINAVEWPGGPEELVSAHRPAFDGLIRSMAREGALDARGDFGTITRVPHALVTGWSVPQRAENAVQAVAGALPGLEADVMHGHVGYFGGLLAARSASPATRVVVTEHSTETANVLADPAGRDLYAEVLERAAALTCVSSAVREIIVHHLPAYSDKIVVLPNPVDFEGVGRRVQPEGQLDRWVFVGGLIERKGVRRLMRAFLRFAEARPAATLDLFGEGNLRAELEDMAKDAGYRDRVTFHGAVAKTSVLRELPTFDLLLAPSVYETFHLAVCEAVAAGLPVVVTRSGGPEEALGETIRLCGRFIDVSDSPDDILDAVADVETNAGELDLVAARGELSERFGPEAVRERLADLYGVEPWTPREHAPEAPPSPPERLEVFARRTWRSPAVEPQVAMARESGVPVGIVGVPQPKPASAPRSLPSRALRKARRWAASLRPVPTAAPRGTVALLGDMTSAGDVSDFLRANPTAQPRVELDPAEFGRPTIDAAR